MSIATSSTHAPWHIMRFDDKRRGRGQAAKAFHEGTLQRQFTRMTFVAERY
jgi:polyphosphate kinase 2 (PPK2 family)